jgi:hypothetical protein
MQYKLSCSCHLPPRSMGLLGVARANTAVGVSPETFLQLLHRGRRTTLLLQQNLCCSSYSVLSIHATDGLHEKWSAPRHVGTLASILNPPPCHHTARAQLRVGQNSNKTVPKTQCQAPTDCLRTTEKQLERYRDRKIECRSRSKLCTCKHNGRLQLTRSRSYWLDLCTAFLCISSPLSYFDGQGTLPLECSARQVDALLPQSSHRWTTLDV